MARPEKEQARFWAKTRVEDRGFLTPCIVWTGRTTDAGYGKFETQRPEHKIVGAHRYAFALVHGEKYLFGTVHGRTHEPDHLCRQTDCVNVEHIEWVTTRENRLRAADARLTDLCRYQKHPRAEYEKIDSLGRPFCGECAREADRRRRQREREARHR